MTGQGSKYSNYTPPSNPNTFEVPEYTDPSDGHVDFIKFADSLPPMGSPVCQAGAGLHVINEADYGQIIDWTPVGPSNARLLLGQAPFYIDAREDGYPASGARNLLTPGEASFETGVDEWSSWNAVMTQSTEQALDGSYSCKLVSSDNNGFNIFQQQSHWAPVVAGEVYTVCASVYGAQSQWRVGIDFLDAAGTLVTEAPWNVAPAGAGWKNNRTTGVVPTGAVWARVIVLIFNGIGAGHTVYIDKVGLWKGTGGDWAPGGDVITISDIIENLGSGGSALNARLGGSGYSSVPGAVNLLSLNQSTFHTDTHGWYARDNCTIQRSTDWGNTENGDSMLVIAVADGHVVVVSSSGTTDVAGHIPVTGGATYTAFMSMRGPLGKAGELTIEWFGTDGYIKGDATFVNLSDIAWTDVRITIDAPPNATTARVDFICGSVTAGDAFYIDRVGLWEGSGGTWVPGGQVLGITNESEKPKFLDWDINDGSFVYLPGTATNYMWVEDDPALDITGDMDLRMHIAADSWAGANSLMSKMNADAAWRLRMDPPGTLILDTYDAAGAGFGHVSTVPVPFADGEGGWVRATIDVDNDAGGHTTRFYTSTDGKTWVQLGEDVVWNGVVTNIKSTIDMVMIGQVSGTTFAGKVYRAIIKDGIDGTTVLDVDCTKLTDGGLNGFPAKTARKNLVPNPSFEEPWTGAVLPGWSIPWGGENTISYSTDWSASGPASALLSPATTGTWNGMRTSNNLPVTAGKTYTASVRLKPKGGTSGLGLMIDWYAAGGTFISTAVYWEPSGQLEERTLSVTGVAPAGAVAAAFALCYGGSQVVGVDEVYVDAAMLEEGTGLLPFFDGYSDGCGWTGPPGNSASLQPDALETTVNVYRSQGTGYKTAILDGGRGGGNLWLFDGQGDFMEVPNNPDLLPFGPNDDFSVVVMQRQWPLYTAGNMALLGNAWTPTNPGWLFWSWGGSSAQYQTMSIRDSDDWVEAQAWASDDGAAEIRIATVNRATDELIAYVGGLATSPMSIGTIDTLQNYKPLSIGDAPRGENHAPAAMELMAVAIFDRVLTPDEIREISEWFAQRYPTDEETILVPEGLDAPIGTQVFIAMTTTGGVQIAGQGAVRLICPQETVLAKYQQACLTYLGNDEWLVSINSAVPTIATPPIPAPIDYNGWRYHIYTATPPGTDEVNYEFVAPATKPTAQVYIVAGGGGGEAAIIDAIGSGGQGGAVSGWRTWPLVQDERYSLSVGCAGLGGDGTINASQIGNAEPGLPSSWESITMAGGVSGKGSSVTPASTPATLDEDLAEVLRIYSGMALTKVGEAGPNGAGPAAATELGMGGGGGFLRKVDYAQVQGDQYWVDTSHWEDRSYGARCQSEQTGSSWVFGDEGSCAMYSGGGAYRSGTGCFNSFNQYQGQAQCPGGWELDGSGYCKTLVPTYETRCYCDNGGSLNGSTCSKQEWVSSGYWAYNWTACAVGYNEVNRICVYAAPVGGGAGGNGGVVVKYPYTPPAATFN